MNECSGCFKIVDNVIHISSHAIYGGWNVCKDCYGVIFK